MLRRRDEAIRISMYSLDKGTNQKVKSGKRREEDCMNGVKNPKRWVVNRLLLL